MTEINPMSEFEAYVPESREADAFVHDIEAFARACAPEPLSFMRRIGSSVLGYILEGAPHVAASFGYLAPGGFYLHHSDGSD